MKIVRDHTGEYEVLEESPSYYIARPLGFGHTVHLLKANCLSVPTSDRKERDA